MKKLFQSLPLSAALVCPALFGQSTMTFSPGLQGPVNKAPSTQPNVFVAARYSEATASDLPVSATENSYNIAYTVKVRVVELQPMRDSYPDGAVQTDEAGNILYIGKLERSEKVGGHPEHVFFRGGSTSLGIHPEAAESTYTEAWTAFVRLDDPSYSTYHGPLVRNGPDVDLTGVAAENAIEAAVTRYQILTSQVNLENPTGLFGSPEFRQESATVDTIPAVDSLSNRGYTDWESLPFGQADPLVAALSTPTAKSKRLKKMQYKFVLTPRSPPTISWLEIFSPKNSTQDISYVYQSWTPQPGEVESQPYTIDPLGLDPADANALERHPAQDGKWEVVLVEPRPVVDGNHDGVITLDGADTVTATQPFMHGPNSNHDGGQTASDAETPGVDGAADLKDFFPLYLDLKQLVSALPPSPTVKYLLKQEDSALNLVYTNLTRDTAFSYLTSTATTGYGREFNKSAATADTQQVTSAGINVFSGEFGSTAFLNAVQTGNGGVILLEARQFSDKPLVLEVEKYGVVVARQEVPLFLAQAELAVDANHDGSIKLVSEDGSDPVTSSKPFRFWINDDDDNVDSVPDANDAVVNGANDLKDFYPVFLDVKQLVTVLTPSSSVVYKLKQEEGALNFVYTNLTRATAFSYVGGTLTTGFGPSFAQPAASATTQPITASGADLFAGSSSFLDAVQNHDGGVLLIEGRQLTDKPLVLSVEKDGAVIVEVKLELCAMHLGKLWETSNKANQIFNRTKKDDSTGNLAVQETEGDATYAVPRNNLYVVADPADNKLKVSLDLGIPATSRTKFIAAAWDGATKIAGSDAAFPADASQSATLQIAASATAETKEYRIKLGRDANGNGLLDDSEASPMEIYRRKDTGELRFATVKGISNAKYDEHKSTIVGKIGFLGQSQPGFPAKYARSFLALFYYQGDFNRIATGVQPNGGTVIRQLDAFANGVGYAEWLTHNSGAVFSDGGVAPVKEYDWNETSEVAEFFAARTPFALESTITNGQGYSEFQTATGATLKTFYGAQVKTAAEQSLQNSPVGTTVTFPLDGGWYEFPRTEAPNQFKSISPGNWVTPSTQIIGTDDGYSGFGALFTDIIAGTDQFNDFDAFGTIGRGRVLNPRYKITVKKEDTGIFTTNIEYKVSAVEFTCDLEDLYDFNYEDGTLPSHAAAMQIGWGKGANGPTRDQGVIFRHKIHIDHTYTYPFDQTVIVNPGP